MADKIVKDNNGNITSAILDVSRKPIAAPSKEQLRKESKQRDPLAVGQYYPQPLNFADIKLLVNTYHQKALSTKTKATVGMGWKLLDSTTNEPIPDEQVPDYMVHANPDASFDDLISSATYDYWEIGNGYLEAVANLRGELTEMYQVLGETIFLRPPRHFYRYLQYYGGSQTEFKRFSRDANGKVTPGMIHFRFANNRSTQYGYPDWANAIPILTLNQQGLDWNSRFFSQGGMPEYVIMISGPEVSISKETMEAARTFWQKNYNGEEGQHKVLLMTAQTKGKAAGAAKIDFERITPEFKDQDFTILRRDTRDEILSSHGTPPRIMGVVAHGQLGGTGEIYGQMQVFRDVEITPAQHNIESKLNSTLFANTGMKIKFNQIDITPPSLDVQDTVRLVDAEVIDAEQAARRLELEKGKDGKYTEEQQEQIEFLRTFILLQKAKEAARRDRRA